MITVVGMVELKKPIIHSELYRNLIVRVGGFNARFVELSSKIQSEIIAKTLY